MLLLFFHIFITSKITFVSIDREALNNGYHRLTKDNWNQTLRKSKIFYQSWARQKIRTKYDGSFDDQVTGQMSYWQSGIEITLQEIVTLKLYTDFDKLQFALKKCFRFETIEDIVAEHKHDVDDGKSIDNDDSKTLKQIIDEKKAYKKTTQDLEDRIRDFFHWRGGLLIILTKFGEKLNGQTLYHGVNTKMIISQTQTFAFYGPLSTTTSPHVARTFATAKGMVLKLTTQFPRLDYCNAFDASLISDYPEEQEWLVGFMYVRVLEIRTRKLVDDPKNFVDIATQIPIASWMRQEFFALHLFREQMFSMNECLERMQAQYLRCNRMECCINAEKYKQKYDDGLGWTDRMSCLCMFAAKHQSATQEDEQLFQSFKANLAAEKHLDLERKRKVYKVFWDKFNYFRQYPNLRQSIKFDKISDILKRFFMEQIDEKDINTKQKKYVISFEEIITVYPNVKEIHFINQYKFDNHVLQRFIEQIQKPDNKLGKISFSYYDYFKTDKSDKPSNDKIFMNPQYLDPIMVKKLTQELKWKIDFGLNGDTGYKIKVYK